MTAPILTDAGDPGPAPWKHALKHAVRDLGELATLLGLPLESLAALAENDARFPLLVPRGYVARMARGRLDDPLLLQVLPRRSERLAVPGFGADPLEERTLARGGVLHKYAARALLITTAACPIHCRYCFRRDFPYSDQLAAREAWQPALQSLARDGSVREVILSGGDPLSLSTQRLADLLDELAAVESVDTVRIHTRFPIVLPERIDAPLLAAFGAFARKLVVVVHCNHAQELDGPVAATLARLGAHVDLLLNQSVLLAGVNDDPEALERLSRRLFECGVLPYYLHMLDKVAGAAAFEVDDERARQLVAGLRGALPGYLVPKLVRETPGDFSKTPL
jgi:EF-P beta-lysylation protein EpmB